MAVSTFPAVSLYRPRPGRAVCASALIVAVAWTLLSAADKKPPVTDAKAAEILKGAVQAYPDGEAGYRRSADYRWEYEAKTITVTPQSSITFRWTVVGRADGATRVEKTTGSSKEIYGADGKGNYWWLPAGSSRAVPASEYHVAEMKLSNVLAGIFLDYEAKGYVALWRRPDAGSQGLERVTFLRRGLDESTPPREPGDRIDYWFEEVRSGDAIKYRVARLSMLHPSPMGGKPVVMGMRFLEYTDVNGCPVARKLVLSRDDKETLEASLVRDGAEVGKKQPDEAFQPPQ